MSDTKKNYIVDMDSSIDDIDDLPEFKQLPSGAYQVLVEESQEKEINEHPAVEVSMKVEEVLELTGELDEDEGEKEPIPGDIFTQAFMMDNEFGAGKFKEFMVPVAEAFGKGKTKRELIKELKGSRLVIIVKRTWNKKKERNYSQVVKLSLV